jgi:hypothetical protein
MSAKQATLDIHEAPARRQEIRRTVYVRCPKCNVRIPDRCSKCGWCGHQWRR